MKGDFPNLLKQEGTVSALVLSATILSLDLPVGIFPGFGPLYLTIFFIHLFFLSIAACCAIVELAKAVPKYNALWSLVALAPLIIVFPLELLPPTATDALIHHLVVPKWWLQSGSIHQISWHEWSYYPMLGQLAYAAILSVASDIWCAVYHGIYLIILAGLVSRCTRLFSTSSLVNVAAIIFTTFLPIWIRLSGVPLVDIMLAVFCLAGIVTLLEDRSGLLNLILAGLALGLAMETKYNGLLAVAAILFALLITQDKIFNAIRSVAIVGFSALVAFLPWCIKNTWWTGNPLYPLLRSKLGGPSISYVGVPRQFSPLLHRVMVYGESWLDLLLLPFRIFLTGQDGDPAHFDGILSPLLLLCIIPMVYLRKDWRVKFLVWIVLFYSLGAVVTTIVRVRYFAPIIPIFSIMAALSFGEKGKRREFILTAVILVQIILGGWYVIKQYQDSNALAYLKGNLDREGYLTRELGDYRLINYVNQNTPKDAVIYLMATSNHFYYFDRPVLSRGFYSVNEVISWLKSGATSDQIAEKFIALKVKYLFVHTARLTEILSGLMTPQETLVWNGFQTNHLKLIQNTESDSLWEVR